MAVNVRKLKDDAAKLVSKGKYDKAVEMLVQVRKSDPKDLQNRVKLGEIYRRLNKPQEAIAEYASLVEDYAGKGFLVQAISVCKMIIQIDPNHRESQEKLAELYARKDGRPIGEPAPAPAAAPPPAAAPAPAAAPPPPPEPQTAPSIDMLLSDDVPGQDVFELEETPAAAPGIDASSLPEIPLFSDLQHEEFIKVLERMKQEKVPAGTIILKEGSSPDCLYIIAEGNADIFKTDEDGEKLLITTVEAGNFFGEFAFLSESVAQASVEAVSDCRMMTISKKDLDEIITEHPAVSQALLEFYKKRVLLTLLNTSPLFAPFDKDEKMDLLQRFEQIDAGRGTVIIQEGTEGEALYLIKSGEVGITKLDERGKKLGLAKLKEGEFFGEISLIARRPTTATVTSTKKSSLLKLAKDDFNEIILTHPQILELMSEYTEARLQAQERIVSSKDDITVTGII